METLNNQNEISAEDLKLNLRQNSQGSNASGQSLSSRPSITSLATSPTTVVVPIPVPIASTSDDVYTYIAVKGSLHAHESSVFGLNRDEISALLKRFPNGSAEIMNGVMVKTSPITLINLLCKLGYKVICTTGETEIVWTLQREI